MTIPSFSPFAKGAGPVLADASSSLILPSSFFCQTNVGFLDWLLLPLLLGLLLLLELLLALFLGLLLLLEVLLALFLGQPLLELLLSLFLG